VRGVRLRPLSTSVPLPGLIHSMSVSSLTAALPVDGRQSPTALAIARGTTRLLHSLGFSALGANGDVWIVEIKSSIADFRADQKWMDYRLHCDRLFFATTLEVPCDIFPLDVGLIVADAYGASIVCEAPEHRLHAATRKTMTLAFARAAALRLSALADPEGSYPRSAAPD
jgi:hypothetical protein